MTSPILPSTALLTVLLAIGLLFFIRASTKDRIEVVRLVTTEPEPVLLERLESYFTERAYRLLAVDAAKEQVTFEGFVRPSFALALFLTLLAAVGLLCLALVLTMLYPAQSRVLPWLALLAPLAGAFYWKKSGRLERVALRFETIPSAANAQQILTVTAHRDELAELQRNLKLTALEEGA